MTPSEYQNPILCADYSDPDIVRVGDDFFMVSSSFNHVPALPILHSTDLVNWTIINHVMDELPLPGYDRYQPGKGVWAPSIRWHDGKLWVCFSTPDEGIFICHTEDPWGEWSAPHCLREARGWIDPCPFWDDNGQAWLVHAFAHSRSGIKHKLQLFAMAPDASELLGEGQIIYDGCCDLPTLEGPKVYQRAGWYYIFAPAGGVENGWQTVLRARQMTGPWEAKNVLFQGNTSINGPHQGGWVEGEEGECWFVHFQDLHLYGRVVHLQPMSWGNDGWPRIGEQIGNGGVGQPVLRWPRPKGLTPSPAMAPQTSDYFAQGQPGIQWQWQANPSPEWLLPAKGELRLRCVPLSEVDGQRALYWAPQLLLQKFPALTVSAKTSVTLYAAQDGDAGGLIVYGERYAALLVEFGQGGYRLVWRHGWMSDAGVVRETRQVLAELKCGKCQLQVAVGEGGLCQFSWRAEEEWRKVPLCFAAGKGKWVGAKFGLLAASMVGLQSEGYSALQDFEVML
ncbi:glycoside hydrolase 43 family protein [Klebsiella pneumoniae]|uniref:glycoside hydrolase family 43 protein n=1 Tax=Klebsiella pneumoniae TaxID=573 RepID=UPI0024057B4C|nr:glycoside hydrolase 43 family protein [Klebsiella pneumoniae]MDG0469005.1 glycoside hydrolase 43 family protein [Klebsiella pneumoniae]